VLDEYSEQNLARWTALLHPGDGLVATAEASPWVKEHAGGILPAMPATGPDLQKLLSQVGLAFNPGPA
jgi:hypothetical protein